MVLLARDLAAVVTLGLILIIVHEFATPFFRGFQCSDDTIRYPFKDSTVSSGVCYAVGSGINVVLILVLEYQILIKETRTINSNGHDREFDGKFQARLYVRRVYCRLIIWLFGAIASELLTDISKFTAGRLRPHFIDVCQPEINGKNFTEFCSQTSDKYQYITNYQCTGNSGKFRDSRLSFMSGHSSYSAYSAAFAVFYIQSTMDITKMGLLKPALQVLIASTAFYTGLTRVSDYKHHWQDVLAGLLQGSSVAALVSQCLWPSFKKTYQKYLRDTLSSSGDDQIGEELNRVSY